MFITKKKHKNFDVLIVLWFVFIVKQYKVSSFKRQKDVNSDSTEKFGVNSRIYNNLFKLMLLLVYVLKILITAVFALN